MNCFHLPNFRPWRKSIFVLLAGWLLTLPAQAQTDTYLTPEGPVKLTVVPNKIYVQYKPGTPELGQNAVLRANQLGGLKTSVALQDDKVVELGQKLDKAALQDLLQNLATDPNVLCTSPMFVYSDGTEQTISRSLLVQLHQRADLGKLNQWADRLQLTIDRENAFAPLLFELSTTPASPGNALEMANELARSNQFAFAQPNFIRFIKRQNSNDPLLNQQWSLNSTGQRGGRAGLDMRVFDAWQISMGSASIRVAIIDSGVDLSHPDLLANFARDGSSNIIGFDATGQGSGGRPGGNDAHGTNCAGIVAAAANNGLGLAGVAPNCKIVSARIFYGAGNATTDVIMAGGINWAWQPAYGAADVLSNSWRAGSNSTAINDAIAAAVTYGRGGKGSLVLFAAGNSNAATIAYPASQPNAISVGAMSMCDQRKSPTSCDGETFWGSQYGPGLDIAAPGVKIQSTDIAGIAGYNTAASPDGDYFADFTGTSSACPNAAGVAALILSVNPNLTHAQARGILEQSCEKVGGVTYTAGAGENASLSWNNELGYGMVNASRAVRLAQGGLCTPTVANGCANGHFINNFSIGTLANLGSGCNAQANNYLNYPTASFTTELTMGTTTTIRVRSGAQAQAFGVWLDLNNDLDFADAGEFIFSSASAGTQEFIGNFLVPTGLRGSAPRRLRVRSRPGAAMTAAESCTAFVNGETEDYTIQLVARPPVIASFTPPSGPIGTVVTLTGNGFTGTTAVAFNGTTAPGFTVNSNTQITATVPAGATGGLISATSLRGTGFSNSDFNVLTCYQALTAATGTVTDGSGAADYANNLNCGWLIQPAGATIIRLTFTEFVLFRGMGLDVVTVYNGPNAGSPQLGRFFGNEFPAVLTATNGAMFITFTSDGANGAAGWSANYTSSSLSIASFTPPSGPIGTVVTLTGNGFTGTTAVAFNGTTAPGFTVNSNTQITATVPAGATSGLISATSLRGTGFSNSDFNVLTCYQALTAATGTVTDGSGAADYANNVNCGWLIQPAGATIIRLTFTAFATESNFDFVTVYNGPNTGSPLLGRFSGNEFPAVLTATNGAMFIAFTSNGANVAAGWSANYTSNSLPVTTIAGFSPAFGPVGTTVTLTGTNFTGATAVSFNNVNAPGHVVNSATQIMVNVPTGATTGPVRVVGINLTAVGPSNFVVAVCGASAPLTAATGTITDGSGAADYVDRLNCSWLIQPPSAGSVTLTFTAFATESNFDFVTVYNGPNATFPQLGRFSGATLPAVLTATNGAMFITFNSDISDVAAGWSAGYTSALLPAPTITGFTPNSGLPGTVVTLTGTGFNGATAVSFNNVNASSFTVNSNIQATATVPTGATTGPVRLAAPGGPATSASNFTVPAHVTWTNSGWVPNQVPNADTDAIIAADYNTAFHGSFIARSLIVNAGSTLLITNGQTVTINSVLDYAGNMVVESGGALIQTPASTLGNVGGQFRAERNAGFPGPPMAYNFWSSPIQNFRISSLTSALPAFRLLYNEAAQQWQVAPAGATDFVAAGRGYTAVNAGSVTFTGVPNNGVLSLPTTRTAGLFAGANLAGNPYPSPILISDGWGDRTGLLEDAANSAFDGSAYVWVDNRLGQGNGTYRAVNASSFLDPGRTGTNQLVNHVTVGQGFFVRRTTGAAGNLNFANSHRIGAWGNTVLFRTEGQEAKHLVLELGRADGTSDQFQLSLHPDFGPGFDRGHDAQKMDGPNGISLAALHDGSRQQLLALPEPGQGERFEVPLSVMANASGPHTFTAGRVNAQPLTNLFLEDRATGEFYYLQTGRSHTLNLQAGNYRDRFYLRRASEVVGRAQVGSSVRAFAFGGDLYIQAAENAQVTIYNTMGVALQHFAQVPGGGLRRLPIDFPLAGVYLVKVATASGTTEQRIWLDK